MRACWHHHVQITIDHDHAKLQSRVKGESLHIRIMRAAEDRKPIILDSGPLGLLVLEAQ